MHVMEHVRFSKFSAGIDFVVTEQKTQFVTLQENGSVFHSVSSSISVSIQCQRSQVDTVLVKMAFVAHQEDESSIESRLEHL